MGKSWDASGIAYDITVWKECLRVLKPGGHMLAFSGSRTYHRMACAIEDAGFQIRDQIMWVYGSGFPKSLNIGKALDKVAGAEREVIGEIRNNQPGGTSAFAEGGVGSYQRGDTTERDVVGGPVTPEAEVWDGWGTALKPAHEPIVLARKPIVGTVANNVLKHGVGGINIDGCRVDGRESDQSRGAKETSNVYAKISVQSLDNAYPKELGRFPANFIHDGSDEVLELFPSVKANESAARFFYCAKASKKDRNEGLDEFEEKRDADRTKDDGAGGDNPRNRSNTAKLNHHPTVKPTDLMRYLCRMITPPNGTVLDPFTGSGSTGKAAVLEGFSFIGVEQSEEYIAIAKARIESAAK